MPDELKIKVSNLNRGRFVCHIHPLNRMNYFGKNILNNRSQWVNQ